MNYGEVQGPINREPDEKLDPSGKSTNNLSTASTGIRRLYVVDSNNFIIVVFNIQIDDFICSIANFFLSIDNNNNNELNNDNCCIYPNATCKCFDSSISLKTEFSTTFSNNSTSVNNENNSKFSNDNFSNKSSCLLADKLVDEQNTCSEVNSHSHTVSSSSNTISSHPTFSLNLNKHIYLFVLLLNIIYLLMCFNINKFFICFVKLIYHFIKWDSCYLIVYLLLLSLPIINLFQFKITTSIRRLKKTRMRKNEKFKNINKFIHSS
jgi:hypothetical protein